jgi:translocation and assembly module TamA
MESVDSTTQRKQRARAWLAFLWVLAAAPGCALFSGERGGEGEEAGQVKVRDRSTQRVRVFIRGIRGEMRTAASGAIELKGLMSRADASDALIRRVHGRAHQQIKTALQPFGYYHANVTSTLELMGKTWMARFVVDPGPPTLVAGLDLDVSAPAAADPVVTTAIASFKPQIGEVIEHRIYESGRDRIADALSARGYLDAQMLEHQVAIRLADHSARIALKFDSGARFNFGETRFEGAHLPADVLAGYQPYKLGQPYRQDRLLELQQRLLDSDYFGEVEIETDREHADGMSVPIIVRTAPAKRTVYSGGVSIGTDSGIGVQGGITRRWVNERGHKFNAGAEISQRLKVLGAQYLIPIPGTDRRAWSASLGYRDEETDTSTQQLVTGLLARQRENQSGSLITGLGVQSGDFVVGDLPGSSTLVYPEVRWTRRRVDDFLNPRKGWSITAEARAAPSGLGDSSFAQLRTDVRLLRPRGDDRWFARLQLGALWAEDFSMMPPTLRYFAGGDRSLRGFTYQTLGPKNVLEKVAGGHYLAVGTFEYEHHLTGDFGLAGFVDAGNAFDAGNFDLAVGAGVGLRWRSPLGLVRLDLAHPFKGDASGLRLHLLIGPEL